MCLSFITTYTKTNKTFNNTFNNTNANTSNNSSFVNPPPPPPTTPLSPNCTSNQQWLLKLIQPRTPPTARMPACSGRAYR